MTAQENFIKKYSGPIVRATLGTPLLPSVKMAQLILETGWGKSIVGNNLFGIKAAGKTTPFWNGGFVQAGTKEVINGKEISTSSKFRAYASQEDSIRDHSFLITNNARYKPVLDATTPESQAQALQDTGYATALNYASSLRTLISKYNLKELDQKKKS